MEAAVVLDPPPPTPIEYCAGLSAHLEVELFFKRDDFLPGPGGGNKVRLVRSILRHALSSSQPFDAVVATGGVRSNLARIVASLAGACGWPCSLVLHGSPTEAEPHVRLLETLGARIVVVPSDEVRGEIEQVLARYGAEGRSPLLVPGGGSTVEGALGYVEAAAELLRQEEELGLAFDAIVMPSGTGGTQAGLVCGLAAAKRYCRVFGISVARSNPRGRIAVISLVKALAERIGLEEAPEVIFRDEWAFGGYEKADERVWESIRLAGQLGGVVLDPTYTGKAFVGLVDLVRSGAIPKGARVLFWHTGGLLNLYSSLLGSA